MVNHLTIREPTIKPSDIFDLIKKNGLKTVDFRFVNTVGSWQRTSMPAVAVDEELLVRGLAMSNTIAKPDLATARHDLLRDTLLIVCDDESRRIASRAQDALRSTGIADTAYVSAHVDCYVVDALAFESPTLAAVRADAIGHERCLDEIARELAGASVAVESYRSTGTSGGASFALKGEALRDAADDVVTLKDVVKTIASRHGKVATFMPKPFFAESGSSMPCFLSLWKDGRPLFYDANGYAECSQTMLYAIGGILTHAASILAFASPSTNSYKRLVPNDDAPVNLAFSSRNGSAAVRISAEPGGSAKTKRFEFRSPDPSAQPYLAFSAMLLACIDGIERKIDPVRAGFGPFDREMSSRSLGEAAKLKTVPRSLRESLAALSLDREYLTARGVFNDHFIEEWIVRKVEADVEPVAARPHPYEHVLYRDC